MYARLGWAGALARLLSGRAGIGLQAGERASHRERRRLFHGRLQSAQLPVGSLVIDDDASFKCETFERPRLIKLKQRIGGLRRRG